MNTSLKLLLTAVVSGVIGFGICYYVKPGTTSEAVAENKPGTATESGKPIVEDGEDSASITADTVPVNPKSKFDVAPISFYLSYRLVKNANTKIDKNFPCVIHKYSELKEYVDAIGKIYEDASPRYEQGVAFYFAKGFGHHFLQTRNSNPNKKDFLFKNKNSIVMLPVLYTLKDTPYLKFRGIESSSTEVSEKVKVVDSVYSPIDFYPKLIIKNHPLGKWVRVRHASDTYDDNEGFDLGQTHP